MDIVLFLILCCSEVWVSARDGNEGKLPTINALRRQYRTMDGSEYIPFSAWKTGHPKVSDNHLNQNCVVYKDSTWEVKKCSDSKSVVCFATIGR